MAKLELGSIIEIPTPRGLAYAQYVNKHRKYGALLRVFAELHEARPREINSVLSGDLQFMAFFPLRAAVNAGIVAVAGKAPIPPEAAEFPTFRAGVVDPTTGKVAVWWLWDGEREWRVGTLSDEQRRLPIRGVWNDTMLIERIVSGWRPESDPTT